MHIISSITTFLFHLQILLTTLIMQVIYADPGVIGGLDTRRARTVAVGAAPANSVSVAADGKASITTIPNNSIQKTTSTPDYAQNQVIRGTGSVYGNQGDAANAGQGFIFAVNGQGAQTTPVLSNGMSFYFPYVFISFQKD